MQYRREIDGIRAVAVVPVICFHAGLPFFEGGFVGVDVFFVISGYLITSILLQDIEKKQFSIARFYERRARRILPALFLVVACCLPFAWLWMTAEQLNQFSLSISAVALFCSNIFFWKQTGYFAPRADLQPLLHTWSLAVEEQYYVIFPIALAIVSRWGRQAVCISIIVVAALSLGLSEWGARVAPQANFFLFPPRAWELMAGAGCSLTLTGKTPKQSELGSILGLALIISAMLLFDASTPTPSVYTLIPVLGTALLILVCGPATMTGRVLGSAPCVGIGLISYSAYLWHQPLLAFARLRSLGEPSPILIGALVICTFPLAYISWRFVEEPFRRRPSPPLPTRRAAFVFAGAGAAMFLGMGVYGHAERGFPWRVPERVWQGTSALQLVSDDCLKDFEATRSEPCRIGQRSNVRIAVIGDSHAAQWIPAMQQLSHSERWQFDVYAKSGCPFAAIDFSYDTVGREYVECSQWRSSVLSKVSASKYSAVVVTSSTIGYTRFNRIDPVSDDRWSKGVERSLKQLQSPTVAALLLSDNAQFREFDPTSCVQMALHFHVNARDRCSVRIADAEDLSARAAEDAVAQRLGAQVVSFDDQFCEGSRCSPVRNNVLLMRDSNHISVAAALQASSTLAVALKRALSRHSTSRQMS